MKRRSFLKQVLPMASGSLLINGIPLNILASTNNLGLSCEEVSDRVLVLIQLAGGNDGLNTLIPVNDYSTYRNYRPNLAILDSGSRAYSNLDSTISLSQQVGIQPEMIALKELYENGNVNFIQDVSYPNNNKSHFKGTDILLSGSDSNSSATNTGWFGNYLDSRYPDFPANYPTNEMPDPLGIQLGDRMVSLGFQRNGGGPVGMVLQGDPSGFFNIISGLGGALPTSMPNSEYGEELAFLAQSQASTSIYGQRLEQVYNLGTNLATYPYYHHSSNKFNPLALQLELVARLLSGGIKTKVFLLRLNGFDNHSNMVDSGDSSQGNHAELLNFLAEGLKAFQADLRALGLARKVLTCTFSEFGRTIGENGSRGTDHGTSAPMIVVGEGVNPGVTGNCPDFSSIYQNNFSTFQYDYRQVIATILQDWLGAGTPNLDVANVGAFETQKLDLVNRNYLDPDTGNTVDLVAPASCYDSQIVFPVEFLSFEATALENNSVECKWQTANEINNELFVVERSQDGIIFEAKGEVLSYGSSNNVQEYTWIDPSPFLDESFYRIKQIDLDGKFSYSETRRVLLADNISNIYEVNTYPNPFVNTLTINIKSNNVNNQTYSMRLYKMNGALVAKKELVSDSTEIQVQIVTESLSKGIYFFETVIVENGFETRIKWEKLVRN